MVILEPGYFLPGIAQIQEDLFVMLTQFRSAGLNLKRGTAKLQRIRPCLKRSKLGMYNLLNISILPGLRITGYLTVGKRR